MASAELTNPTQKKAELTKLSIHASTYVKEKENGAVLFHAVWTQCAKTKGESGVATAAGLIQHAGHQPA